MLSYRCLLLSGLLAIVVGANSHVARAVEWIAHRGESADAPENTLAAFRLAYERGVPTVELDVHLTKDNRLAVIHDGTTKRTAGIDRSIKNLRFDELHDLDVGRWKATKWSGEKIPTLEESLALIPSNSRCFIEVKVGPEAVPALVKAVEQCGKSPSQLCVISFKAETIAEAKRRLPQLQAYYLADFKRDKETEKWQPTARELIAKAKVIQADGLNLSYKGPIDAEFVGQVKNAGLQLYVWTVDDLEEAKKFERLGVDGITSNKAAWMRQKLSLTPVAK
jgi:glycerophosphoryl diester phosphodiesterase